MIVCAAIGRRRRRHHRRRHPLARPGRSIRAPFDRRPYFLQAAAAADAVAHDSCVKRHPTALKHFFRPTLGRLYRRDRDSVGSMQEVQVGAR